MDKRLAAVAKELNTGMQTLCDYLAKKGFGEFSPNPSTKISEEMHNSLLKEFGSSAVLKKQADEISIGLRGKREDAPVAPPVVNTPTTESPTPPVVVTPPVSDVPKKEETIKNDTEKVSVNEDNVENKNSVSPKVLGKIDLSQFAPKPKISKTETPKAEPKKETPKTEAPKVEPKKETPKTEAPKVEPKKETPKVEAKIEQPKVETPTSEVKNEEITDDTYRGTAPTLRGVKVMGVIQLPESERGGRHAREQQRKKAKEDAKVREVKEAEAKKAKEEAIKNNTEGPKKPRKRKKLITTDFPDRNLNNNSGGGNNQNNNNNSGGGNNQNNNNNSGGGNNQNNNNNSGGGNNQNNNNNNNNSGGGGNNQNNQNRSGPNNNNNNRPNYQGNNNNRPNDNRPGDNRNKPADANKPANAAAPANNTTPPSNQNSPNNNAHKGKKGKKGDEYVKAKELDAEEKLRQTMARIQGSNKKKKFGQDRKSRDERKESDRVRDAEEQDELPLQVTEYISVSELASLLDISSSEVISSCMKMGVFVSINQRLEADVIELVAAEFGRDIEFISAEEQVETEDEVEDAPEDLLFRAPIVTVMGHVDHGKTSLLDYIRKAKVAAGEAGGITQHIGAYEVKLHEDELSKITFLDTPGHEAFTAMRARGAKVTDIAIIIVSADDAIMPQTKEAISHAQAAGVPMVFAINKIDKDGANPEKIKEQLAAMNILVEDWGGKYQSQDISAKKGLFVDELLEKVLLQAEILELKANPNRLAVGAVLEAALDKGRGYVTKVLVQNGTLKVGDPIVAGPFFGKVRAMFNEKGVKVKTAGPSAPVLILGLDGAPRAGEKIKAMTNESEAKQLASKRAQIIREQEIRATKRITLKDIGRRLALGSFKQLNLIIKGDFDGSVEALSDSLQKQSTENVIVNIVHKAVGQVTETDVMLASASDAIIIAFQVRPSTNARKVAEQEGVEIKHYSVIYEAIEQVQSAIEGLLDPVMEERITCNVEVRETFKISKVGTIAGCFVQEGLITRNTLIRIIRNGIVIFPTKEGQQGELASLKRFKDDVKEVKAGFECGLNIKNYNEIAVGDIVEGYEIYEVKPKARN